MVVIDIGWVQALAGAATLIAPMGYVYHYYAKKIEQRHEYRMEKLEKQMNQKPDYVPKQVRDRD